MKLEQSFEVDAPLDQVWAALIDVQRVAPNLPGAAVTGRNDDGTYNGTFTIKIGPTTAAYTGKLEMRDIDEAGHSATMYAQGTDKRGQGGATATISSRLTSANGGTRVDVATDYHITGRLARFGRGGMIEDISERLLREFAARLQSSLEGSGAAAAGPDADAAASGGETAAGGAGATAAEGAGAAATEGAGVAVAEGADADTAEQATTETAMPPPTEAAEPGEAGTEAAEPAPPPAPPEAAPPPPPPPPGAGPPPPPPPGAGAPPPQTPPTEGAPPVQGLSLVGGVLLDRIKRNPAPLIGIVAGLVLLRLLFRRR
jgi:carbon monoxide dehydrogenase subunit G